MKKLLPFIEFFGFLLEVSAFIYAGYILALGHIVLSGVMLMVAMSAAYVVGKIIIIRTEDRVRNEQK